MIKCIVDPRAFCGIGRCFLLVFRSMYLKKLARNRQESGFTLIEVLVAAAVIVAIGVAVASATATNASARRVLDEKIQATNLVTAYLEAIRQMEYSDESDAYSNVSANIVSPPQYIVTTHIAYSDDGNTWDSTNHSGTWHLQKISITVSREGGRVVLTACTFRSPRIK